MIYVGYRVRKFRGRHGYWQLVYHYGVEGVTTAAAWVGLGAAFGNPFMEAILSYVFPRMLNKIMDTM